MGLWAIPAPPLGGLLGPLDAARSRLLRALAPIPAARRAIVAREPRVALVASILLLFAFALACSLPIAVIAVGPLVWGIPHIVSDVRYLVVRPRLHRRAWILVVIGGATIAGALGLGVRGALLGAAVAMVFARGSVARRAVGVAVVGAVFALAQWAGWKADLAFVHLHNLVGVGLWWAWRRRESKLHWAPLALFAAGCALISTGTVDSIAAHTGGLQAAWTRLDIHRLAWSTSPVLEGPLLPRFFVLYAFGQSAHYLVWLRLMPEDDRPSPSPRSFAQSYRALKADVGGVVLWLALAGMAMLVAWVMWRGIGDARDRYIDLAFFHGYLELVAAALLWAESGLRAPVARPPRDAAADAVLPA
jgi:hypothetical protein